MTSQPHRGCFLLKGSIYQHKISNRYYLAAGFYKYAGIRIPMKSIESQGIVSWMCKNVFFDVGRVAVWFLGGEFWQ